MKERPILFSGAMVRALLDGSKTQTRQIVKRQHLKFFEQSAAEMLDGWGARPFPYGQPGNRLWVREAWRTVEEADNLPSRDLDVGYRLWYEADAPHQPGFGKLRPSMFMPRWASRITLEVTGVRVERLQDMHEDDAVAEGTPGGHGAIPNYPYHATSLEHYRWLWESINGPGSWDKNPWVWAVEFKKVTP